jgi:hypothetical protein
LNIQNQTRHFSSAVPPSFSKGRKVSFSCTNVGQIVNYSPDVS